MWHVHFGKLSADGSSFENAYSLSCQRANCGLEDTTDDDLAPLARAVDVAQIAIQPKASRYNVNVFRETDGNITVYFTPGNTDPNIILLGGDYRVSVSKDGNTVLESTPLHLSILKQSTSAPNGAEMMGTMVTNVLTQTPNETDVAMTILNPIIAPKIVICENWMYRIEKNGRIVVITKLERD